MLALVVALGMTAQTSPKRLVKSGQQKTMKQLADEFAKKQKHAKTITAKDLRKKAQTRAGEDDADRWETLIYEDFSLMTKGTEDVPDGTMYPEDYETTYNMYLPDDLFHTPGWFGLGVYQAGGNMALNYPGFGGVLNSPMMNMQGRIRMQLRVKCIDRARLFFISIAAGGYDNPFDPSDSQGGQQMNIYNFEPEDGWQDIEVYVNIPYAGSDCFFQLNAATYGDGGLIVDYIKVSRDKDYISTPQNLAATKFVTDGFTASWDKAYGADNYLVSLYERKTVGTDNYKTEESFEDASLDNGAVTGLADGWTAMTSGDGFTTDAADGSKALLLSTSSDYVQFELNGSEILDGKLYIKRVDTNGECSDMLYFDVTTEGQTMTWYTSLESVSVDEWTEISLAELSDFPVGLASTVKIYKGAGWGEEGVFAIDNLSFETTPLTETTCVAENVSTADTCMTFNDLDLNNLYSFTVQATSADGRTSDASEAYFAYGVAAPVVKEATDVDRRGGYMANWEKAINATSYDLYSYEIYTVPEDTEDFTVFEENFNKCTEGTLDNPVSLNNYDPIIINDYTDNIGWSGWGTLLSNGMVGCINNYVDLQSPAINLDRAGGNYTVTVDFVTLNDNVDFIVQGDNTMYQLINAEKAGSHTATVEMNGGTNTTRLLFYTYDCSAFLIDRVVVKQDVKAGDEITTTLGMQTLDGDATSARISGLQIKSGCKYGYNLVSYYDRFGLVYVSDPSATQYVEFEGTGIDSVETEDGEAQQPTEIYDLSGRKVSTPNAKGVYIIKSGGEVKKVRF
jgi:hypothetical protein